MATHHAQPGEIVDVRPLGSALADTKARTLLAATGLAIFLFNLSGCSKPTPAKTVPFRMSDHENGAALRIDDLTIVFVGLDCKVETMGQIPVTGSHNVRSGRSDRSGGVETQSVDGVAKLIVQKGDGDSATYYTFTIEDGGKKLIYGSESYSIGNGSKEIVIAADGTTTLNDE